MILAREVVRWVVVEVWQYVAPPILNRYMYSQSCLPLHKTGTMAILRWPSVRGSRVAALLARNKIR